MNRAFVLAPLFALAAIACGATNDPDDDLDTDDAEQDLSAACTLGPRCASLQLLTARTFIDKTAPNVTRSDLLVTTPDVPTRTPKIFARKTSGEIRYTGGRVTLSGNAAGDAELAVDDVILIEVLATDGRLLNVTSVRPAATDLRLAGNAVPSIAPSVPWVGIDKGFRYAPKSIDIASVLPRDTPFRLRISALDYAGVALVSDVFLHHDNEVTPPPPPVADPFSPDACTGDALTFKEAVRRFAPGQSRVSLGPLTAFARQRSCHVTTGCGAWQASDQIVFGLSTRNATVRLPLTSSSAVLTAGNNSVQLTTSAAAAGGSFHFDFIAVDGSGWSDQGGVLTGAGLIHSRAGRAVRANCARIVIPQSQRVDSARSIEHETVLLAKY